MKDKQVITRLDYLLCLTTHNYCGLLNDNKEQYKEDYFDSNMINVRITSLLNDNKEQYKEDYFDSNMINVRITSLLNDNKKQYKEDYFDFNMINVRITNSYLE